MGRVEAVVSRTLVPYGVVGHRDRYSHYNIPYQEGFSEYEISNIPVLGEIDHLPYLWLGQPEKNPKRLTLTPDGTEPTRIFWPLPGCHLTLASEIREEEWVTQTIEVHFATSQLTFPLLLLVVIYAGSNPTTIRVFIPPTLLPRLRTQPVLSLG